MLEADVVDEQIIKGGSSNGISEQVKDRESRWENRTDRDKLTRLFRWLLLFLNLTRFSFLQFPRNRGILSLLVNDLAWESLPY